MAAPDEIALFAERLNTVGAEYMITGATAAILYGQPRATNDVDVVVALREEHLPALLAAFPDRDFYVPPQSVIRVEQARRLRGHFNIIHHDSGYKADIYLAGDDPLHAWALGLRREIAWTGALTLQVAPPEYVILRKLEFFREGGSTEHTADVRAIVANTSLDLEAIDAWARRLGVEQLWAEVRRS